MQISDSLSAAFDSTRQHVVDVGATVTDLTFWYGIGETAVRVALTIGVALLVLGLIGRYKRRWVRRTMADPGMDKRRQRVLTVADLLGSGARYLVWTLTAISVLGLVGFEIGPLLASAGIAGLAIGFGAQTLVKDVIGGFFLLFDNTLGYGDLITFNGETATVEYVGLRLIKARKFDGELLMIPAGEMRMFGNKSIGYARVIVPVGVSYEQNINEALGALEDVVTEWAATERARTIMLEEAPQVQAVLDLGESAVQARVVVQVRPGEQFEAERDLRRLIKERFDEMGVEIPFPRRTIYMKHLPDDTPPPEEI
jgi:small conductance mechanosensitive channel